MKFFVNMYRTIDYLSIKIKSHQIIMYRIMVIEINYQSFYQLHISENNQVVTFVRNVLTKRKEKPFSYLVSLSKFYFLH